MKLENRTDLTLLRDQWREKRAEETTRILICGGTGCLAGGSQKLYERMRELAADAKNIEIEFGPEAAHIGVKKSGCHGFCEMGPLVRIEPYNYLYLKVKLEDCDEIFNVVEHKGVCPNCGSFQKTVLSGKDFTIREIVVPDDRAES